MKTTEVMEVVMGMATAMAAGVSTALVGLGASLLVEATEEKEEGMGGTWDLVVRALVEQDILWELFTVVKQGPVACMEEAQAVRYLEEALVTRGLDRALGRLALAEASRRSVSIPPF